MSSAFYSFINSVTNSITSRYDIKHQVSSAGLWKIYQGVRKTTGKKVSIFIFEKKSLDAALKRERNSRQDAEFVYELLKKEAGNLARLRHPSILEVVEPVNESRSSIVFVTEPLMGSLTQLVKSSDNYSSDSAEPGLDLDELEIQKGLLQVGKGLQFLNDAKVVHHNLTTDAIFVNAKGDWKIGGLGFSVFLNSGNTSNEYDNNSSNDFLPEACQINMDYAAPEFIIDNNLAQSNDMFALGCLAYAVHNKGASLLKTFNSFHTYEKQIKTLPSQTFSKMPTHLQPVIRQLLTRHPNQRMSPVDFQNSKYFDNLLVSTMKFLESFPEKTREEKGQFMKGLSRVIGQFPERVLKRKILPSLLEELKDHQLLPFTIPNIFIITQSLSQQEFCDLVLPVLKPVFQVRDPPQNMIVLLEKLDVLQQKTPRETFRDDVMPLVYAALETTTSVVQEKALRIIPSLAESLDYTAVKSSLFPRVQTLFVQTTILSVKVSTLICFHSMIKVLDKFTIQEKLVPILKNIKTKEPAVMLATLAVYDEIGKVADKEIIATEIMPQLWRMSFGPLLNLEQFSKFMKTIHDLTNRVEEAHMRHLREVKSLEEQTRSVSATASPQIMNQPAIGDAEVTFESLVQGKSVSAKVSQDNNNNDMFGSSNTLEWTSAPSQQPTMKTPTLTPSTAKTTTSNGWSSSPKPVAATTMNNNNNNQWSQPSRSTPMYQQQQQQQLQSSIPPLSNPLSFQSQNIKPIQTPPMNAMANLSLNHNNNNNNNNLMNTMNTSMNSMNTMSPMNNINSRNTMNNTSMNVMNPMNSMNTGGGGGNYDAFRSFNSSSSNTLTPQTTTTMLPLNPNMGLLKPTSAAPSNTNSSNQPKVNIHAFDPLG